MTIMTILQQAQEIGLDTYDRDACATSRFNIGLRPDFRQDTYLHINEGGIGDFLPELEGAAIFTLAEAVRAARRIPQTRDADLRIIQI